MNASVAFNVNLTCLACDGTRPCAQCRAAAKALVAAGHRVHRSSRYAALRAAADGTYGFSACVIPVQAGERNIADAIAALLSEKRVALAVDDALELPAQMPEHFVAFASADYRAGILPKDWLAGLSRSDVTPERNVVREPNVVFRASAASSDDNVVPERSSGHLTRRLRSALARTQPSPEHPAQLLEDELAWYRASGIGFALALISIAGVAPQAAAAAIQQSLRSIDVAAARESDCIALLGGLSSTHARAVVRRIIAATCKRLGVAARAARSGIAVCPDDGDGAHLLLARAAERL